MYPRRPFNPRAGDRGNDSGAESTGNGLNNATEWFRRTIYRNNGTDRVSRQINAEQTGAAGASSSEGNPNNPRPGLRRMPAYSDLRPIINPGGGDRGNDSGASSSERAQRRVHWPDNLDSQSGRVTNLDHSGEEQTEVPGDNWHLQGRGGPPAYENAISDPPAYENTSAAAPPAYENASSDPPHSRESDRRQQGE